MTATYLRFLAPALLCRVEYESDPTRRDRFAIVSYDRTVSVEFNVTEGWSEDHQVLIASRIGMERMQSTLARYIKKHGRMP